jgi:8-oxo-dGTP pyrophosphatase MutT (NUDIX family)
MKYTVQAVLLNKEGYVLGVSRKKDHNDMGLPGGKVDDDDKSLEDAIKREVKEETGLDIDMSTAIQVFSMHRDGYMGYTYLIKDWSGEISTDEPHVVKWCIYQDLYLGSFGKWNLMVFESLESMGVNINLFGDE